MPARTGTPVAIKLLDQKPKYQKYQVLLYLAREAPEAPQSMKGMFAAVGCLPELDRKTL